MQNIKLRGFVRVFLFGCLAVCGLEALASGGVAGLPNLIEGGYVYSYDSLDGNTTNNLENIYGRIPHQVEDYAPPTDGGTNVIYMARTESFTVSNDWTFCGWNGYGAAEKIPSTNKTTGVQQFIRCANERGHILFKVLNNANYSNECAYGAAYSTLCHFTNNVTGGFGCIQVYLVSRSDAFYRIPRNGDAYYVKPGTTLWFCKFDGYAGSPWSAEKSDLPCESTGTFGRYDTFEIKDDAAPGEYHLKTEDERVDITVHVVADGFEFKSYILYMNGTNEVRQLSDILFETGSGYSIADVDSVRAVDNERGVSVAGPNGIGDYVLKAEGLHDFDRLVVVTMKNGNVVLIKLTSVTGRCDETLCASEAPVILPGDFQNLLLKDDGRTLRPMTDWLKTDKIDNAPPGYTNVWMRNPSGWSLTSA